MHSLKLLRDGESWGRRELCRAYGYGPGPPITIILTKLFNFQLGKQ